jgi:peroxiredoxin
MIMVRTFRIGFILSIIFLINTVLEGPLLFAQKVQSFQIKLEVENLKVSAKVILTVRDISQWTEYTAESTNGKFTLKGKLQDPSFAYLVLKYSSELDQGPRLGNIMELFLDEVPLTIVAKDSLRLATVQGGPNQKDLEVYKKISSQLVHETEDERGRIVSKFIGDHPGSSVSLYAIQNFSMDGSFTPNVKYGMSMFELLSTDLKNSQSGKAIFKDILIAKQTSIGSEVPDFSQRDTLDREVKLSSFRGKYVLIDFWASWCRPCRVENPMLVKTFHKYSSKNFTILGISLDNNKNNWLKAIRKDKLVWTQLSDLKFWKNEVALQYGIKSVPQNILIDPEGKIIGKNISPSHLDEVLENLLR